MGRKIGVNKPAKVPSGTTHPQLLSGMCKSYLDSHRLYADGRFKPIPQFGGWIVVIIVPINELMGYDMIHGYTIYSLILPRLSNPGVFLRRF